MNKPIYKYEYLIFIVMLYMAIDLSSMVFAYKIIKIGSIFLAASSLIFPLTYSIMDVIAEVYGYQLAKKIIIYGFICDLIFGMLTFIVCQIPSSPYSQNIAYIQVLGLLLRAVIAQMAGVLVGSFINIYFISKLKMITNGRYFWLRSIGSSTVGEGVMLVTSVLIAFVGVLSYSKLYHLIANAYLYKILFAIIVSPFISIAAIFLKKRSCNEDNINFNPFSKPNKMDFFSSFQKS